MTREAHRRSSSLGVPKHQPEILSHLEAREYGARTLHRARR